MSVKRLTYYSLACDWPGCRSEPDYGDYSAWGEQGIAEEQASESGWRSGEGDTHFCGNHPAEWDVDLEDGSKPLEGPHLLGSDETGLFAYVDGKTDV